MRKLIALIFLFNLLSACQDVVEVDVPRTEPELVIEGWVTDSLPVVVQLSTTDAFFNAGSTPVVTGAEVILLENDNPVETLMEVDSLPGTYRGNFIGSVGNEYSIRAKVPAGFPGKVSGNWRSGHESMKRVAQIDSLNIRKLDRNTRPSAFREGNYALLYFQELPGEGDIIRVNRWLDDSLFQRSLFVIEDQGVDGFYFGQGIVPPIGVYGPFDDQPLGETQKFRVRFESITRNYQDFLRLVDEQTSVGSPFDAPPALVIGNIYREGDTADYAFGYFRASALSTDSISYTP